MRYLIVRRALILLSALGVAATGCDNSCEGVYRCPPVSATGGEAGSGSADPCPEDPAAGGVENECGVWVSASWGNDESGGTQEAPVATIARAVTLAEGRTGRVYVCGELYQEVVQLPGGVSLSGGFSCKGGVWSYDGEDRKATIAPGFPAIASMLLREGTGQSLITDLRVEAVNAVEPGASSIAVMAFGGAEATFDRCTLVAGNGADGADGKNGGHSGAPAHPGLPGNPGDHACTANPGLGGLAVKLDCDGVVTSGGNGGDGGNGFASGGFPGLQPPDPNPEGYGAGGKAQDAVQSTLCTPGIGGIQGNSGDHGAGGTDWGRLTVDGFIGAPGADGFPGTPGQGGGGGGGSIGSAICGAGAPGAPHGGAGGGSGGTGGCGGGAGKGGQGGGSSFGIAALEARLTLHKIEFILGNGGNGGNGGALQLGGQGGFPGLGGLGFGGVAGVTAGCHGGAGGQGGSGGNGGGGRGGHSFAHVSLSGYAILSPGPIEYTKFGTHGAGGKGGNANLEGTSGLVGFVGTGAILVP